jgi:hypothetical protein
MIPHVESVGEFFGRMPAKTTEQLHENRKSVKQNGAKAATTGIALDIGMALVSRDNRGPLPLPLPTVLEPKVGEGPSVQRQPENRVRESLQADAV